MTISRSRELNAPKGHRPPAQGWRASAYLGHRPTNHQPQPGCVNSVFVWRSCDVGLNPVGVVIFFGRFPRVARASRPWALGRNAVGVLLAFSCPIKLLREADGLLDGFFCFDRQAEDERAVNDGSMTILREAADLVSGHALPDGGEGFVLAAFVADEEQEQAVVLETFDHLVIEVRAAVAAPVWKWFEHRRVNEWPKQHNPGLQVAEVVGLDRRLIATTL